MAASACSPSELTTSRPTRPLPRFPAGIGVLYLLLEVRPSGLLPPDDGRGDPIGRGALS